MKNNTQYWPLSSTHMHTHKHTHTHMCMPPRTYIHFLKSCQKKLSTELQISNDWASPANVQQDLHGTRGREKRGWLLAFMSALSQALKHQNRYLLAFYWVLLYQMTHQEENQSKDCTSLLAYLIPNSWGRISLRLFFLPEHTYIEIFLFAKS